MAVYVTDTHPLVWYAAHQHKKLSKRVLRIFDQAVNNQALIYVPAVVLWEISLLQKIGHINLQVPFERWAAALINKPGFDMVPLDLEIMAEAIGVNINGDPFDEAIVATARVKDIHLITRDTAITESKLVDIIW